MRIAGQRAMWLACAALVAASAGCGRRSPDDEPRAPGVAHAQAAAPAQVDPNAPLHCYKAARGRLRLANRTAYLLCNGAPSLAPVQCFEAARARTRLLDWQIVNLCRCTGSVEPVACFDEGDDDASVSDDALVGLCAATATQQLRPNCAPFAAAAR